jgi:hypothetical protein
MEEKVLEHIFDRMRSRQTDDSDIDYIKSLLFSNLRWQKEKPNKPCVVVIKISIVEGCRDYDIRWIKNKKELSKLSADSYLILEELCR